MFYRVIGSAEDVRVTWMQGDQVISGGNEATPSIHSVTPRTPGTHKYTCKASTPTFELEPLDLYINVFGK